MSDADPGANRRKFPRLRDNCRIRVRRLAGASVPGAEGAESVTVNISGGGLCYRSDVRVERGEFLAIELTMPDFTNPVVALARVAWVAGDATPVDVGVEFWWVGWGDDAAQRAIADYIKSELKQDA